MLETNRLDLKLSDLDFVNDVLEFYLENKGFLREWEPSKAKAFFSVAYLEAVLNNEIEQTKFGGLYRFWIYKKENEKLIGNICLSNIVRGAFQSCHIGYKLGEKEMNKGYMSESLEAVIKFAFENLKLHRLEANIMPRNSASMKLVKKIDFREEGLAKRYIKINGKWEDHIHMVLLNKTVEK